MKVLSILISAGWWLAMLGSMCLVIVYHTDAGYHSANVLLNLRNDSSQLNFDPGSGRGFGASGSKTSVRP